MAYDDPQLVHYDQVLTNISVAYRNEDFIGDLLFPAVTVGDQSGKYNVLERTGTKTLADLRGPKGNTNEIPPMGLSRDEYFANEHSLKDWVSDEEVQAADAPMQPLGEAAERVSDTILLNRENAIQAMARTAANYATNHTVTLSGTAQWNDYANSDPIGDLKTAVNQIQGAIQRYPTIAAVGYAVAIELEDHPDFLDRIKAQPSPQMIGRDLALIAQIVGLPRLVRAAALVDATPWGTGAASLGRMWGKDVVVAYVPGSPGPRTPAFGYEFNYPMDGQVMPSDRWYDRDRKSTAVRVGRRYDLKFIAVDSVATGKSTGGYLIKNAVA